MLSFKRRNSLSAALEVAIRLGGMNIKAIYLIHSPKVKNIKIISRGSGNFRSNLKFGWKKLGKTTIAKPRIRNRVMKLREGSRKKTKSFKSTAMKFDQVRSDNVKRIIWWWFKIHINKIHIIDSKRVKNIITKTTTTNIFFIPSCFWSSSSCIYSFILFFFLECFIVGAYSEIIEFIECLIRE